MLVNIVYNMPSLLLGICIVAITVAVAIVGLFVTRKIFDNTIPEMNHVVIGLSHQAGIIFAIVVGFVAVAVFQSYNSAGVTVENESNDAFSIWVDARAYPADFELQVRQAVEKYINTVVKDEWPLQSQGQVCLEASRAMEDLYRLLIDFVPKTRAEEIVHAQVLRKVNDMFKERTSRLYINEHGLEAAVYYEIIFSILIVLGFAWAFCAQKPKTYLLLTTMLGVGIGLVFFLIVTFDWPFRGEVSISSRQFQDVLQHIQRLQVEQPPSPGI